MRWRTESSICRLYNTYLYAGDFKRASSTMNNIVRHVVDCGDDAERYESVLHSCRHTLRVAEDDNARPFALLKAYASVSDTVLMDTTLG